MVVLIEMVYGFVGDVLSIVVCRKIFKVKGWLMNDLLIVYIYVLM